MGDTITDKPSPLLFTKEHQEGYLLSDYCWGTYMHGILNNQQVIDDVLGSISTGIPLSYESFKEKNYDKLAALLRNHLDIDLIYSHITTDND